MSYQVLYRKYRPKEFAEVVGQESVVRALSNAVATNRIAHAYLFSGPRGVGKTTMARILAKAANGFEDEADVDIIEIDAASTGGVDEIRELREGVRFAPARGKFKTYIIDEVHMLSKGAFNALLKTLEEPPAHAIFILATTEIEKVPATIISRTQHYEFRRPSTSAVAERLMKIGHAEGTKLDEDAARVIALAADDSIRDAESILGQILAVEDKHVTRTEVEDALGLPRREAILAFFRALTEKKASEAVAVIRQVTEQGHDAGQLLRQTLTLARSAALAKLDPNLLPALSENLLPEEAKALGALIQQAPLERLKKILSILLEAQTTIRRSPIPELPLELAALEIASLS